MINNPLSVRGKYKHSYDITAQDLFPSKVVQKN